jgi:transcriptional regulator with XRE-family HTH domain
MPKENRSASIEEVQALFRKNPEYVKAERLVNPYYELAAKIINLRVRKNLTQKELAEKAETYQSRISKIESGEHDVRLSTLTKIAEALESRLVINVVPIEEEISQVVNSVDTKLYKALFSNIPARIESQNYISYSLDTKKEHSYFMSNTLTTQ